MEYIQAARTPEDECILCELPLKEPEEALLLKKTARAFAVMNLYPYNPGHVMVAPLRHTGALESLDPDELLHMGKLLQECVDVLQATLAPDGFNLGMNLGKAAGAGVPGHLHWHVVPRWGGDANFMPIVGDTRVIPEMVGETFRKLRPGFQDVHS